MKSLINIVLFSLGEFFIFFISLGMMSSFCNSLPKSLFFDVCESLGFILFIIIFYCIYYINNYNLFKFCEFNKIKLNIFVKSVILGLSIPFVSHILLLITQNILNLDMSSFNKVIQTYNLEMTNWFGILFISLLGPIYEEIFFRGIMLRQFLKYINPVVAITIQALLFSISHGNVPQIIYTFVLGIILGITAYYTKSIITSIIIHALNNSLFIILMPINQTRMLNYLCIVSIFSIAYVLVSLKNNKIVV